MSARSSTRGFVTREEIAEYPRRLLRKLIDKKMPAGQGGFRHVGQACSPLGRQIEQTRHYAFRAIEHQRGALHPTLDILGVVFEIHGAGRTIVGARS